MASRLSNTVFVTAYILVWGFHAMLIKISKMGREEYPYDILVMGLNIELVKLLLSVAYLVHRDRDKSSRVVEAFQRLWHHRHLAKWFAVPAGIYCLGNALAFVNISLVSIATTRVLMNLRVLFSGVLLRFFFNKLLTPKQWFALILLILGCTYEQIGSFSLEGGGFLTLLLLCLHPFCSSLAGVYFQWLLQRKEGKETQDIGLVEKNIFLYLWTVLFNTVYILFFRTNSLTLEKIWITYEIAFLPIMLIGACGGFCTSLLLRYLDVIAKEYANTGEMFFCALLSFLFLGTPLNWQMIGGVILVAVSVSLYNSEARKLDAAAKAVVKDSDEEDGVQLATVAPVRKTER